MPLNQWVHLAMTYDGNTQILYVNGIEAGREATGWPITADVTPLTIGAGLNIDTVNENLTGRIDEVRIYSRALSPTEVASLAN